MPPLSSKLSERWKQIANVFMLRVSAPGTIQLPSGVTVEVDVLLRDFGGPQGMVIVADYSTISPYKKELRLAGYGCSVMSEPSTEPFPSEEDLFEVLDDWVWTGNKGDEPPWFRKRRVKSEA